MKIEWTIPFHGVQHTKGPFDSNRASCTIVAYKNFVVLTLKHPGCGFFVSQKTVKTVLGAKRIAAKFLRGYPPFV